MDIKVKLSKLTVFNALLALCLCVSFSSCSTIYEDNSDCYHCFRVRFKYDMNMKFADAFANTVSYVTLYVYDAETGELVHKQAEGGEALTQEGYTMTLTGLEPGTYDLLAWCGDGLHDGNFSVPSQDYGEMVEANICTMGREEGGKITSDVGQLYHGFQRVTFEDNYYPQTQTLALTKNTNTVRVVLQHLSGVDVEPDYFRFEIKDENGVMAHDNSLVEDEILTYSPWSVTAGSAGIDADIYQMKSQTSVSVALAEFTVGRLMEDENPVLSIYNVLEGDKKVLSIPLKDYALLVKGYYNKNMSDQEYLDRQDEYNLTFFLDEHGNWLTSQVIINSWHLVFQNSELK